MGQNSELVAELIEIKDDGNRVLRFTYEGAFEEVLDKLGNMPLPPYIVETFKGKREISNCICSKEGSQ